jgi:hypothetical protein
MDLSAGARSSIQGRGPPGIPPVGPPEERTTYGSCIVTVFRTDDQSSIPKKAKKEESK